MPNIRLTQAAVERLTPPKEGRVVYWDKHLPGFGLRLTSKGARTWVAIYRVGGKQVWETIGSMAVLPKVEDARAGARASMERAAAGAHPVIERRIAAEHNAMNTVAAAVARYLADGAREWRPKTLRTYRQLFEYDILPAWGERPLSSITKADILALLDAKASRRALPRRGFTGGATVQAGKLLNRLRTFWSWAIGRDLADTDPTIGIRWATKEAQRDRVLDDAEIFRFWTACEQMGAPFGHVFKLLLLTAQRESEVAGMRWSEVDDKRVWTIPGERAKNGKPHFVHLSTLAFDVLQQVGRVADQDLVFTTTTRVPVSGFSRAKRQLDALMGDPPHFVLHDLRRTATTGMARLGIAPHVADRVLNHQAGVIRGVSAVYNRFEYLDERRAALDAWASFLDRLVRPVPAAVIPITAARATS